MSTVEADIAKVLEETLALGVTETEQESQAFDEALFEEDFTKWLDDFVARHGEPELGSIHSVADKEVNMPIDDLLIQISDDLLLPISTAEVTMIKLGAFSPSGDKGKGKLIEDEQVTDNAARKLFALICRDVEVLVQVRDHLMQAVVDFFASFSLNSMPDMDSLKDLKEKRVVNLLSVAHSNSIEELKAQQQELNIELVQSHSSLPAMDYIDSGDVRLAHFYSIANSSCWVRPVFLINGVWTPAQGPEIWSSSCKLSLLLDNLQMPEPAIQKLFVPLISFIEPDQYWATVPWLMRIWRWTKVCEEVVAFNLSGGLRPVRKDACYAITVHNLGVERIPANFLRLFAQGLACNNFVDSVVKKDLGDGEDVVLTDIEEVELVSSDVSTVYRSPSPPSPGVDSLEHDLRFALGPAIFSRTEQEERLYFVQSPDSPPAVSPHHESSSSSTDVSLHFDSTDVPVHAQAATHAPASVDSTKLVEILEDLQSSLSQRIHDSNCEMLSKLNSVELGVRGDLLKMQSLLRQSFETACRVLERQSNTHTAQITDLKKGLMGPVGIIFGDLFEIKKKQREQDAKQQSMDEQIAAIRNEHLEFQSKIAADMLSLSTQVGDIADFLRSGVAKKGEMVQGSCHNCGQPGHFLRRSGFQPSGPSRFGAPQRPQFQIPQQAQANALTREHAEETSGMVIGGKKIELAEIRALQNVASRRPVKAPWVRPPRKRVMPDSRDAPRRGIISLREERSRTSESKLHNEIAMLREELLKKQKESDEKSKSCETLRGELEEKSKFTMCCDRSCNNLRKIFCGANDRYRASSDFRAEVLQQALTIYDQVVVDCRRQLRETKLVSEDIVRMIETSVPEPGDENNDEHLGTLGEILGDIDDDEMIEALRQHPI
ncbi:hypothetical protein F511_39995 [Dorcoceras hygrometricum]|uniref:Uncharacterized protein n=1 Tax=Dorcoceras hygrometricum TaxID=472368 RepID=A0A2Z7BVC1_9LAMI|nr:hypothetical protein F511_39995 [Dorcoceras hygrometricum]